MKKRRIFRNLNNKEFAWVLYDVGNSAYTMLACALIPIWFKAMAIGTKPGQLTSDRATAYYSMAIAVITIVVALLGPVCGSISDYKGMKKIFFTSTVAVICLFLWLILYGREINFPSVLVETGRKYAFLIYLLHPAMSDLLKKCSEGLGVSNCQIYFWLRPVLVYMLTVVTVSGISAVSAYARQNILQNDHV